MVRMNRTSAVFCALIAAATTADAFSPAVSLAAAAGRTSPASLVPTVPSTTGSTTTSTSTSTRLQALPAVDAASTANLSTFFLQTVIANGIPALFTIVVLGFAGIMFRKKDANSQMNAATVSSNPAAKLYLDLYGDQDQDAAAAAGSSGLKRFFGGGKEETALPKNVGVPAQQYIKMTSLNAKLDSYGYSVQAAVESQAAAAAAFRKASFRGALAASTAVQELAPHAVATLQKAEAAFLKSGGELSQEIQTLQTDLTAMAVDDELGRMGIADAYDLDPATAAAIAIATDASATATATAITVNATAVTTATATGTKQDSKKSKTPSKKNMKKYKEFLTNLGKAQRDLQGAEMAFVQDVVAAVGPSNAAAVRTALLGDVAARGLGGMLTQLQERPLSVIFGGAATKKTVYVTRFPGDASASQVADLREEVTAIIRQCKAGDEAVVILQTGGGTVTGYGLAAAQLMRFKEAGLKLTVAVEQVAASGGYMMCCIADHIVASPFAVLGSIGVISDIPNFYDRLKQEGIEFQTVTAGKYKRTLTPTKKVTKEDFQKTKNDVEDIYLLFRNFVAQNRPSLDIEAVATGETWFGSDALDRKLCDEIKTVDSVLTDFVDADYNVYEVAYEPPQETPQLSQLLPFGASAKNQDSGIIGRGIRWLVRTAAAEVKAEFGGGFDLSQPVEKRYMALDDTAQRIKSQD